MKFRQQTTLHSGFSIILAVWKDLQKIFCADELSIRGGNGTFWIKIDKPQIKVIQFSKIAAKWITANHANASQIFTQNTQKTLKTLLTFYAVRGILLL